LKFEITIGPCIICLWKMLLFEITIQKCELESILNCYIIILDEFFYLVYNVQNDDELNLIHWKVERIKGHHFPFTVMMFLRT